jgi:DNA-binding response OmpR family regulator
MDLCRQIRASSTVPVIILSARTAETDKVIGLGLGADDYVTKPFSPGELVARLKAQIRRSYRLTGEAAAGRETLRFGTLEIDCSSRVVRKGGRPCDLSAREFDLLAFLARHPRQVFSREQLFDRVWGEHRFGDINTVTVHISRVRDKIEDDASRPAFIRTVWGAGYRFDGGEA